MWTLRCFNACVQMLVELSDTGVAGAADALNNYIVKCVQKYVINYRHILPKTS